MTPPSPRRRVWLAPVGINILIASCLVGALIFEGPADVIASALIAIACVVAFVLLPALHRRSRISAHDPGRRASALGDAKALVRAHRE